MKGYIRLFKNKNYLLLYTAQNISNFGDSLSLLAFPLFAYSISGNVSSSGLILASETIPWILIGPILGIFIDRYNKKKFMLFADIIRVFLVGCLFFVSHIYMAYFVSLLLGLFTTAFLTARAAIVPYILKEEDIQSGITFLSISRNIITVIGPAMGAILLKFLTIKYLFVIDAFTYLISFILVIFMTINGISNSQSTLKKFSEEVLVGIKFILNNYPIKTLIKLDFIKTIVEAIIAIAIIDLVKRVMLLTDSYYGMILTSSAVGIMVGTIITGKVDILKYKYLLIFISSIIATVLLFFHALHLNFLQLLIIWFLYGIVLGVREIIPAVVFAIMVMEEFRGKVYSFANSTVSLAYVIGYIVSSKLIVLVGLKLTFIFCGALLGLTHLLYFLSISRKFVKFSN